MKRAKNPSPSGLSKATVFLLVSIQMLVFIFAPVRIFQQEQSVGLSSVYAETQSVTVTPFSVSCDGHDCTLNDVSAGCRPTDATKCNSNDKIILSKLAGCSSNAGVLSALPVVGGPLSLFAGGNGYYSFSCSDLQKQQADQAAETLSHVASCTGGLSNLTPTCLFFGLTAGVIGIFTQLAVWILAIAGGLFSWLVQHTVIEFSSLYSVIQSGVERAWSAFRDIANILIIGIFTFIAIGTIVGLENYNAKKLVARVLIIAVLINFSLLFAKIIVDASNYSALQIYSAAGFGTGVSGSAASAATASGGIADQFLGLLGVNGFGSAFSAVFTIASTDNIGTAFLHGFLVFVILVGAALVLFYGCFLLLSRVIIIIFLMVTASIAFASYLVPGWAKSHYGWKTWWESLLKSAVFAPMLMFFLWMTLTVGTDLQKGVGKLGSFGDVAANPTSAQNINSLFVYCLILGMLFVSFKLSSLFASRIAGFNLASMATALPFTLGSQIAAFGLRQTAGLLGAKSQSARLAEMKAARDHAAILRQEEGEAFNNMSPMAAKYGAEAKKYEQLAAGKLKSAQRAGIFAGGRYNLADTAAAKAAMKGIGISGFAAGASSKDTKGYEGQQKARVEAAEKLAAKAAPSAGDNEKARNEARRVVREQREATEEQLETTRRLEKDAAEQIKQINQLPQKLAGAQQNLGVETNLASIEKTRIAADTTLSAADQKSQMKDQDDRIKRATLNVSLIQKGIDAVDGPWKAAEKALEDHQTETRRLADNAAKTIVAAMGEAGENIAEQVGRKSGDILTRAIGAPTGANREVGKATKDLYKKKRDTASLTSVIAQIQADSPAAPTPPTTP